LRQRAATSTTTVGGVERPAGLEIACFKALLFRSARNLCLNTLRLEKYRAGSSEALEEIVATDESSRDTELSEMKTLIKKALARLPFEQREAFVLHEYSGYSYAEIAEMMGTSEQNVKVRAYRARLRLRKVISSWLGLGEDDDPTNSL
jgi:RNA polymerase sigma-70 factor (ECF subfamily)